MTWCKVDAAIKDICATCASKEICWLYEVWQKNRAEMEALEELDSDKQ